MSCDYSCNEKLCDSHTNNGSAVRAVFKRLDPLGGRPTSANLDAGQRFPPEVWYKETLDLVGFDYGTPSYHKWLGLIGPGKPAISSESSSATSDRGEYHSNHTEAHVSAMNAAPYHATGYGNDEYAWTGIEAQARVPTPGNICALQILQILQFTPDSGPFMTQFCVEYR